MTCPHFVIRHSRIRHFPLGVLGGLCGFLFSLRHLLIPVDSRIEAQFRKASANCPFTLTYACGEMSADSDTSEFARAAEILALRSPQPGFNPLPLLNRTG